MANPIDFDAIELQGRVFVIDVPRIVASKFTWFLVLFAGSLSVLLGFFMRAVLDNMNYVEVFPREIIFPVIMYGFTAFVVALVVVLVRVPRTLLAKSVVAVLLSLSLVNYDSRLLAVTDTIKAVLPFLSSGDQIGYVSIIFLMVLLILAVYIGKIFERTTQKFVRVKAKDVSIGLFVLLAYLFIVPAISFTQIMTMVARQSRVAAAPLGEAKQQTDKPDIYYIVLDRYTNDDVLQKQFNYDNSEFTNYLEQNNFVVNKNAHSNYPYTAMSVASTLSANYLDEYVRPFKDDSVQSRTLYHSLIWNSNVISQLKQSGYEYYSVGSRYGATYKAPMATVDFAWVMKLSGFGTAKRLRGVEMYEFQKSPFYRFAELSWSPIKYSRLDDIEQTRSQIQQLRDLAQAPAGGKFVFAHMLVPHDPFVFNADGSYNANPGVDSYGRPVKQKYIEQVAFINDQMQQVIEMVQKNSGGQAVVLLNADEGPYPQSMNDTFLNPQSHYKTNETIANDEDMRTWSEEWLSMKFGIQQAVHIPRATEADLQNLSSVNLFRIVLNRYAGQELPYLPQCHYGISNGTKREFNFSDVSEKFEQNPDASCGWKQSLPTK